MDANGNDLLVGSQFSRNDPGNGNVIVCNLNTGAVSNFVGQSSGWGYLDQTVSADGARYRNSAFQLWFKGRQATVINFLQNTNTVCQQQ
jgi:membrane-bound inhibitor of C-type lysozyme